MNFQQYIMQQALAHPSTQPQDIIKQCYQAAYGAEHLLSDLERARAYLEQEYAATVAADLPLYEMISDQICRVNLAAWKQAGLPTARLFDMFAASATATGDSDPETRKTCFLAYLEEADALLRENRFPGSVPFSFPLEDWTSCLTEYKAGHMGPVHHSERYRLQESPAYRIVRYELVQQLPEFFHL